MTIATRLTGRLALAAGLTLLACQHPVKQRLEGTWHGDGVENVEDEHLAAATGWAKGTAMEFSGSTVEIVIPAEERRTAQYRVAKVKGDRVLLALNERGRRDPGELRLILDQEHIIRWDVGESRYIVMRRLEPDLLIGL